MIEIIDEDTVRSSDWGITHFVPSPKGKKNDWICRHCLFYRSQSLEECEQIPCRSDERTDGQNGYFTIRQVPIEPLFPRSEIG